MSQVTDRPARHGLGNLVDGYVRRKLRRDIHPALDALRDHGNAPAGNSQVIASRSSVRGEDKESMEISQSTPSPDNKDDYDLYEVQSKATSTTDVYCV
jgi:hypothetical protein